MELCDEEMNCDDGRNALDSFFKFNTFTTAYSSFIDEISSNAVIDNSILKSFPYFDSKKVKRAFDDNLKKEIMISFLDMTARAKLKEKWSLLNELESQQPQDFIAWRPNGDLDHDTKPQRIKNLKEQIEKLRKLIDEESHKAKLLESKCKNIALECLSVSSDMEEAQSNIYEAIQMVDKIDHYLKLN